MTTNQPLLNFRLAELLKFHLPKTLMSKPSKQMYEMLSFAVHPSLGAIGNRAKFFENGHYLDLFDNYPEECDPELQKNFLNLLTVHFITLKDLADSFAKHNQFDSNKWQVQSEKYATTINACFQSLLDVFGTLPDWATVIQADMQNITE